MDAADGFNWYIADLIVEMQMDDEPLKLVWKNTVLIHATSPEMAYQRALELGEQENHSFQDVFGRETIAKFRGLSELIQLYEQLEDGAELFFNEKHDQSEEDIQSSLRPKENLAIFRQMGAHKPREHNLVLDGDMHCYGEKDYDAAIALYSEALQLKPSAAFIYLKRSLAYYFKGDDESGLTDFKQALTLKPDFARAYVVRGDFFSKKDAYERAIVDYSKAIELKPDYARAFMLRGIAHCQTKDYVSGMNDYDQAIILDSDNALIYYNRALAYSDLEQYDHVENDYTKAIELDSDFTNAYINRAYNRMYGRNYKGAIVDFEAALKRTADENDIEDIKHELTVLSKLKDAK